MQLTAPPPPSLVVYLYTLPPLIVRLYVCHSVSASPPSLSINVFLSLLESVPLALSPAPAFLLLPPLCPPPHPLNHPTPPLSYPSLAPHPAAASLASAPPPPPPHTHTPHPGSPSIGRDCCCSSPCCPSRSSRGPVPSPTGSRAVFLLLLPVWRLPPIRSRPPPAPRALSSGIIVWTSSPSPAAGPTAKRSPRFRSLLLRPRDKNNISIDRQELENQVR